MPCFCPLKGWLSQKRTSNGKRSVVFNLRDGLSDRPVTIPCGQCIGCRLERSRQWAIRCLHESTLYKRNCFITLTYDDEHLPSDMSLNVSHFQKFMKRLRKRYGKGVRYFHCGEYGEIGSRPHYHACLFNFDFKDRKLWSVRESVRLYTSEELSSLWENGFSTVGDVTFESAAYVARYVMKKITGDAADAHYEHVDLDTGVVSYRTPEYVTMSRRPGIGRGWYDKFKDDVYNYDFVVVNGKKCRAPRYYDGCFEAEHPSSGLWQNSDMRKLKSDRVKKAKVHACDNFDDRLLVRDEVARERIKFLKRTL